MFLGFTTDVCAEALLYALCQALKLLLMGKQIVELHNDIHDGSGTKVSSPPYRVAGLLKLVQ